MTTPQLEGSTMNPPTPADYLAQFVQSLGITEPLDAIHSVTVQPLDAAVTLHLAAHNDINGVITYTIPNWRRAGQVTE